MPTTGARYEITETPEIAHALELAEHKWPNESRSELVLRILNLGSSVLEREQNDEVQRRLAALNAIKGKYTGMFPPGYLEELRKDWPE